MRANSSLDILSLPALLAVVRPLAEEAGRATLAFYGGQAGTREKADGSPVTLADEAAEAVILPALRALTPGIPVVSEEEVAQGIGPSRVGARFWLVDPLDGTKEFLSGNGEFTVNIALIEDGRPVLGVVVAPALGETYGRRGGQGLLDRCRERAGDPLPPLRRRRGRRSSVPARMAMPLPWRPSSRVAAWPLSARPEAR